MPLCGHKEMPACDFQVVPSGEAMVSSGVDEGFSGKAKLTARKAYGLKTPQGIEIPLFHGIGNPARAGMYLQTLLKKP